MIGSLLFVLGVNSALGESIPATLSAPTVSPWSVGLETGLGARMMPPRDIPTGVTSRLDLLVLEVRGPFPELIPRPWNLAPERLDVQLDWWHVYVSSAGSRRPRIPICAYGTWIRPGWKRWSVALSTGLYTELGTDHFVVNEQVRRAPAGTVAVAGRVGIEKPRYWRKATTLGLYVRMAGGVSLGTDPDQLLLSGYYRAGLERSWVFGRKIRRPR